MRDTTETRPGHFIIAGAQKSGTTTLYAMLSHHPDICMSDRKETDFFARGANGDFSYDSYRKLFSGDGRWLGEASPVYAMRHEFPGVAERIHTAVPEARIIYVVRDPVARAISQYKHDYLAGRIPDTRFPGPLEERIGHCIATSSYFEQLSPFAELFPKDRILVLDFDELVTNPTSTARRITDFLDLPPLPDEALRVGALNSVEDRRAKPAVMLRNWNNPLLERIRSALPHWVVEQLKLVYRLMPRRDIPPLPEPALQLVRRSVAADAARLREYSGIPFEKWTV